jgi:hypothetical protein
MRKIKEWFHLSKEESSDKIPENHLQELQKSLQSQLDLVQDQLGITHPWVVILEQKLNTNSNFSHTLQVSFLLQPNLHFGQN